MPRWVGSALLLLAFPQVHFGQNSDLVGVRLGPVPEALYAHMPHLPKYAWLVEDVAADGPIHKAGLRRHDIILSVAGQSPKNSAELFTNLLEGAGKKLSLAIVRQGKERPLTLALPSADSLAKSSLKPGGPPAVTVQAQPQKDGQLQLTIYYYPENSSKIERLSCQAPVADIEKQFHDLAKMKQVPVQVQDLVEVALRRLRELNAPKQKQ